jgi:predicted secreted protein
MEKIKLTAALLLVLVLAFAMPLGALAAPAAQGDATAAGMSLNIIPGVYVSAVYPAADASGLVQVLELYENQNAHLLSFYLGNDVPIVEQGTWASDDPPAVTLTLTGQADQAYATPAVVDFTFDAGKLDDGTMVLTKLWEISPEELEARTMPKLPDTPPANEDPSGVYVSAVYPAADASGMVELLALYANNAAELNSIYVGKDAPVVELGTWQLNADGAVELTLTGTADKPYDQPSVTTYTRGGDALDDGLFVLFQLEEVTPEALDAATVAALGTELVTAFFDALQAGDADAIDAMLAPAFQLIRFSGERYDAANYLDNLPVFEAYDLGNVYATHDGDVLVVTYDVMTDTTMGDGEADFGALAPRLSVFQQIDGAWMLLAHANLAAAGDSATSDATATTLVVDRKAQVAAGGTVDIELPGIPTTGYIWQVVANDESILLPIDYQFIADSDAEGSGGVEKFSFHAMAPGTVDLRLVQSQPWVTDEPPADIFAITIEVLDTWPSDDATITAGMGENGQTVAILPGNVLMVALGGAADGAWQLVQGDAMVVQPLGDWRKAPAAGDATLATFKHAFLGVQGGTAALQFEFVPADGGPATATYDLTVQVPAMEPGSSGAVDVTEAEAGEDFALAVGDTLVVRLAANPTTGYDWRLVSTNATLLPAAGDPQYAQAGELVGAGGVVTFRFLAEAAGEATVQLGEFAPGADDSDKTLDYNVTIFDPAPLTGNTVQASDADAGKAIDLAVGDMLNLQIPANPSTGYFWILTANDGAVLRLQPESGYTAESDLPGAPGTEDFSFRALMPGTVNLQIGEFPPGADAPDKTLEYEVTVE